MSQFIPFVSVAAGGALGSMARYLISGLLLSRNSNGRFPLGTFVVNIVGCLLIGLLSGFVAKHNFFSANTRLFLITGIAGGFTTFSTFGLESFKLLRHNQLLMAGSYVVASIVIGLLALWLGFSLISEKCLP